MIRAIPSLPSMPELDLDLELVKVPSFAPITFEPQPLGKGENELEKAAKQDVDATLPERIVWKALEEQRLAFRTQVTLFGGVSPGGARVDFLIYNIRARPVVLRVQGDYWHGRSFPARQARDDEQAGRLRAAGYLPVDLWESDIYQAVRYKRVWGYIEGEINRA